MANEHTLDSSRILYQDEQCVVVNKLPGEAAEGPAGGMTDLPRLLAAACPGPTLPGAVHRLDVPVSGCLLFARNPGALSFLSAAFSAPGQRGVEKRYWAVTETPPPSGEPAGSGELVHWIKHDPRTNKSRAFDEPGPGRKKAVLRYRLAGRGERYLFFEIELVTGRHHQIRAQLARLGLPVKGDLKYGARRSEKGGGIRLHARSLCFPSPVAPDKVIRVTAPPPLRDSLWDAFISLMG
ncbi:MAG: RNA pseudouridine synthase [Treponema sp.]|jgi:23S rRNA pseudouridine1911/1915/1917 synthase|nr:RNA pseudouridine synthase [Treponema sp.]